MTESHAKFQRDQYKIVVVAPSRYGRYIDIESIEGRKKCLSAHILENVTKHLRIIYKPHAHLQTMPKASAKFKKDRYKTVGEVTHTSYL